MRETVRGTEWLARETMLVTDGVVVADGVVIAGITDGVIMLATKARTAGFELET